MKRQSVVFTRPRMVEIVEETLADDLGDHQILAQTVVSAISPGTELLIYRGQAPDDLAMDDTLAALSGSFAFPIKYGYSAVGRVIKMGKAVDRSWLDKLIFAFNPHETFFVANVQDIHIVPEGISPEEAAFLPNIETAVNFVMDGRPMIGEHVVVFGQGIVGLLTAALLRQTPLARVIAVDRYPSRREASLRLGVEASLDPDNPDFIAEALQHLGSDSLASGADLSLELSGSPVALDQAIKVTGFAGRIVIGSWYGQKPVSLSLGGKFHRSRITLISSQVSTIHPELTGRWDKTRRFQVAWDAIRQIRPAQFITHRVPFEQAAEAYRLYDEQPQDALQIVLTYGSSQ